MKSNASPKLTPAIRRIATNGVRYRIEFKSESMKEWTACDTLYKTLEEAKKIMDILNESDSILAGEWNVVE